MSPPSLSIVIPAYNEARRLSSTLPELIARLASTDTEIVVVDDGSSDETATVARQHLGAAARGQVVQLAANCGKGAAVRAGVNVATGDIVLYMDADLATDLGALDAMLNAIKEADIVVGSRAVPGAVVHGTTLGRAVMGRTFNRMVRVLTRLDVHDTQCGFKAFRGPVAKLLFATSRVDSFAFDAEILHHARILGFRIVEVPVDWTAVDGSSVRPIADSISTALDLMRVVIRSRPTKVRAAARALGWLPADA